MARLGAIGAAAVTISATTDALVATTTTLGVVGARHGMGLLLPGLEISESSSFVVDISNLSIALNVEISDLLTGRGFERFHVEEDHDLR